MRFLHIADVHLDTAFACRSSDVRDRLRRALRAAFARCVDTAIVPPISLDSSLAIHPGSKREEARDVLGVRKGRTARAAWGGRPASPSGGARGGKSEVVVRLLRGEDIGEVSRETRVAPPELERWRREFLQGGREGLKGKKRPGGELMRTRAKLGEMTMRVELQAELLEKRGYGDELRKLLRRLDG